METTRCQACCSTEPAWPFFSEKSPRNILLAGQASVASRRLGPGASETRSLGLTIWPATALQASAAARNARRLGFLPRPDGLRAHNKAAAGVLALRVRTAGGPGLRSAIETAIGAAEPKRSTTMATIGTFTRRGDTFQGAVRTLSLDVELDIRAAEKSGDNAPDYRIFARGAGRGPAGQDAELGAAWKKTSAQSRDYLSVKIDDPAFGPLFATLVEDAARPAHYTLIWTRS